MGSIQEPELQHKPAVLATCIALLEQSEDVAGAVRTVQEALEWWQNSMTADKASQAAAESWLQQQMVHLQLKVICQLTAAVQLLFPNMSPGFCSRLVHLQLKAPRLVAVSVCGDGLCYRLLQWAGNLTIMC